jgi:molecular chaperone GrpE
LSDERKTAEERERTEASEQDGEMEEVASGDDLEQLAKAARAAILNLKPDAFEDELDEAEAEELDLAEEAPPAGAGLRIAELEEALAHKDVELAQKEAELGQKDAEVGQLRDRVLRLAAEFDNFKKRSRKERQDMVQYANEELIKQLLPVLDNFERALESGGPDVPEAFFKGVELIYTQAVNIFDRLGLKAIEAIGKPFDPNLHEAMMREAKAELPENVVVQELRRGYYLNEKVIRQSMVSVSTRPPEAPVQEVPDTEDGPGEEAPAELSSENPTTVSGSEEQS